MQWLSGAVAKKTKQPNQYSAARFFFVVQLSLYAVGMVYRHRSEQQN